MGRPNGVARKAIVRRRMRVSSSAISFSVTLATCCMNDATSLRMTSINSGAPLRVTHARNDGDDARACTTAQLSLAAGTHLLAYLAVSFPSRTFCSCARFVRRSSSARSLWTCICLEARELRDAPWSTADPLTPSAAAPRAPRADIRLGRDGARYFVTAVCLGY